MLVLAFHSLPRTTPHLQTFLEKSQKCFYSWIPLSGIRWGRQVSLHVEVTSVNSARDSTASARKLLNHLISLSASVLSSGPYRTTDTEGIALNRQIIELPQPQPVTSLCLVLGTESLIKGNSHRKESGGVGLSQLAPQTSQGQGGEEWKHTPTKGSLLVNCNFHCPPNAPQVGFGDTHSLTGLYWLPFSWLSQNSSSESQSPSVVRSLRKEVFKMLIRMCHFQRSLALSFKEHIKWNIYYILLKKERKRSKNGKKNDSVPSKDGLKWLPLTRGLVLNHRVNRGDVHSQKFVWLTRVKVRRPPRSEPLWQAYLCAGLGRPKFENHCCREILLVTLDLGPPLGHERLGLIFRKMAQKGSRQILPHTATSHPGIFFFFFLLDGPGWVPKATDRWYRLESDLVERVIRAHIKSLSSRIFWTSSSTWKVTGSLLDD